ncbi:MAG: hypothetical protein GDA51_13125 [Ekhidna sp.]|nr:hypothetical protein [Ekhidna sp.]
MNGCDCYSENNIFHELYFSNKEKAIFFEAGLANTIGAILSSNLFFWYYQIFSNNLDLKTNEIDSFTIPVKHLDDKMIRKIKSLYKSYLADIEKHANIRKTSKYANIEEFKEYKIRYSKNIIDQIDDLICPLYGLSDTETEYIKNYEIEYRIE